jgi:putative iron-dependent peroxidase
MSGKNWDRVPIEAQSIDAPLSQAAIFLVVTVASGQTALTQVCAALDGVDDLVKTVGFRDLSGRLSCIVGIGRDFWDRLHFDKRPQELKPFAAIEGAVHAAPSTPGDLLFHIRSERPDLCFEFERLLLDSLGASVTVVDEVSGFRYFDARDLLGFVDGTANPTGLDLPASALVSDEDADFEGGSYVVVHDRLLHFSTPHTGTTFFAPTRPMLQTLVRVAQDKLATA